MHDNWQFAVTLGAIILGAFYNNRKSDDVRKELDGKIERVHMALHSDINLLTGKFIELIDRLAKIEAKLEAKS
jgi:hypothetical protein